MLGLPLFFGLDKRQPPPPLPPPPPPANSLISCAPFTERNQQRQRSYGHHWTSKVFSQKYKILQAPTV